MRRLKTFLLLVTLLFGSSYISAMEGRSKDLVPYPCFLCGIELKKEEGRALIGDDYMHRGCFTEYLDYRGNSSVLAERFPMLSPKERDDLEIELQKMDRIWKKISIGAKTGFVALLSFGLYKLLSWR
ncbi:unnamed protein product [marine sediment metagenome]|uniref:Uncharacterized protein n=1 Tax=marine sediment metagenome TaxID=412755 RepID=X0ZFZ3_9ZZZZ